MNIHKTSLLTLSTLRFTALLLTAMVSSPAWADELPPPPLGIVCEPETSYDSSAIDQAEERQDWPALVRAERVSVAGACENTYRWLKLARAYGLAGQPAEALQAAFYAFQQDPNDVSETVLQFEMLTHLPQTPGFANSAWGQAWEAAKKTRDERVRAGQARLAALPANARPAEKFVTGETCPFECCTYGDWSVEEDSELYVAANGAKLGRTVKAGEKVVGLTGNVHLRPRPILVQRAFEAYLLEGDWEPVPVPAGEILFELEYLGEGNSAMWHHGKLLAADVSGIPTDGCLVLNDRCWGDFLAAPREDPAEYQWWVKIRLQDGTEAWARADGFGNMDGCG